MPQRTKTPQEAFAIRTERVGSCLEWVGCRNRDGYGSMRFDGKPTLAHRAAYTLAHGEIPDGAEIDHECGNRACVEVTHLRIANRKQNMENQQSAHRNSKSGIRGVYWMAANNRWAVQVRHNKKIHYAGMFDDLQEAERVAIDLRNKLFTHNLRDREPVSA